MDIIDCVSSSNLLSDDGYILSQIRKAVSDSVRKGTERKNFLWIRDVQIRSFMMQMQHGLNACSLQASGCSMLPLLPLEW